MSLTNDIASNRLLDEEIATNFIDMNQPLSDKQVLVASERCLFCHDAPCITACPTSIDIPLFIRKINTGNHHGAAKEILSANILGGSCARVCPTETLCEQVCVRNTHEEAPVEIGRLQRYAVDNIDTSLPYPFTRAETTGKHIAIVGAGPAGLSCAHRLAREGHQVTIFEAAEKSGGLNEYGIALYKLVDDYTQKEIEFVLKIGGIEVQNGKALGRDVSLEKLRADYDAVFVSIGISDVNKLNIPGEDYPEVIDAVTYIREIRQTNKLTSLPVGRRVIVIGAGMTAIDIAVQIKKLGAEDVSIVYHRDRAAMGASNHEQELAQKNGVQFICNAKPKQIIGDDSGITTMVFNQTVTGEDGKLAITENTIMLPCDVVFKAIGQKFDGSPLASTSIETPKLDIRGRIAVDVNFESSIDGVYAGGDCINGKDLVVEAVDHGNKAAIAIHSKLQQG